MRTEASSPYNIPVAATKTAFRPQDALLWALSLGYKTESVNRLCVISLTNMLKDWNASKLGCI